MNLESHASAMHHVRVMTERRTVKDYRTMLIIDALDKRIEAIAIQYKAGKHGLNTKEKPYTFKKKK